MASRSRRAGQGSASLTRRPARCGAPLRHAQTPQRRPLRRFSLSPAYRARPDRPRPSGPARARTGRPRPRPRPSGPAGARPCPAPARAPEALCVGARLGLRPKRAQEKRFRKIHGRAGAYSVCQTPVLLCVMNHTGRGRLSAPPRGWTQTPREADLCPPAGHKSFSFNIKGFNLVVAHLGPTWGPLVSTNDFNDLQAGGHIFFGDGAHLCPPIYVAN